MGTRALLPIVSIENISDAGIPPPWHIKGQPLNDGSNSFARNEWLDVVLGPGFDGGKNHAQTTLNSTHQKYRSAHAPLDQVIIKGWASTPEGVCPIWVDSLDGNYTPFGGVAGDIDRWDRGDNPHSFNSDENGNSYTIRTLVTFNAGTLWEEKRWLGHWNAGEDPQSDDVAGSRSNGMNPRGKWIAAATMTSEQDVYTFENGEGRNDSTEIDCFNYLRSISLTLPASQPHGGASLTRNHTREDIYEEPANHLEQGRQRPSSWKTVKTITCRPGDWIKLITAKSDTRYGAWIGTGSSSGHLLTRVNFGSNRSGAFLKNNVRILYPNVDTGMPVAAEMNVTYIRVPTNAKSGPFRMMGRKWTTTWRGRRKHFLGAAPSKRGRDTWEDDVPIPIYVIGGGGPLAIEAFQCGLSNTGSVVGRGNAENMINSSGNLTQKGDSSQIGTSPLITIPPCRNNMAMSPGTYFPLGMTAGSVQFITGYVKEMRFRVSMLANAANYTPAITYMQMLSMVTLVTPMMAIVGQAAVSVYNSIYQSLILHEMGQASGGSSIMKLHRTEAIFNTEYEGLEDTTQPAGPTTCSFSKVMQSKQGGSTISAIMLFDFSKLRYVPTNPLHESFSEQGPSAGGKAVKMLDCEGKIVVLNEDGTVKDHRATYAWSMNQECRTADYDGYWAVSSSDNTPQKVDGCGDGAPLGCEHTQAADGTWSQASGTGCTQKCMEMDPLKPDFQKYTKATTLVNGWKDLPAGTPINEWVYSHQNNLTDPTTGKKLVHSRWVWGMTPIMSPLPFRNVATDYNAAKRSTRFAFYDTAGTLVLSDHKKDFHPQPGWHHHTAWDHFRSEGLAAGGGLYFPWFWASAIGKGQLTTVSSTIYSEDYKCLKCSAKDWGKDARLCRYNNNALGTGGWFLGEGGSASFYLFGSPIRAAGEAYSAFAASKNTTLIAGIQAYQNELPASLRLYYKPRDIDKHDIAKAAAGEHYGGWPENVFASSAAYARQAGSSCFFSDHEVHIMKGHGYEFWGQGCIPTFVKNDINVWDIMHGNLRKWDKMRNSGRLLITERIDQIYVTEVLLDPVAGTWLNVDTDTYEFYPGQFVRIRCFPATTTTSTPTKAVKIRSFDDYSPISDKTSPGGGGQFKTTPDPLGIAGIFIGGSRLSNNPTLTGHRKGISELYTIGTTGKQIGSYAMGAATPYSMRFGTTSGAINLNGGYVTALMVSSTIQGQWAKFDHIGGRNSEILQLNSNKYFGSFDKVSPGIAGASKFGKNPPCHLACAIACGQVIDDSMEIGKPKPWISPWYKGLLTSDQALRSDVYAGSFFKNLRGVSWGKNGPACEYEVEDAQTMWVKIPQTAGQTHHSSDDSVKPPFSWAGTETNQFYLYYESPIGWATEFNKEGEGKWSLYEIEQKALMAAGKHSNPMASYNGAYPSVCYIPVIGRCRVKTKNFMEGIDSTLLLK